MSATFISATYSTYAHPERRRREGRRKENAHVWRSSPYQNIVVISLFFSFIFVQIFSSNLSTVRYPHLWWPCFLRQIEFLRCLNFFDYLWNCSDCLETFQTIRKLSRQFGNFPNCLENFQTVRQLSRLSGNFSDCPETFPSVWKLSRLSVNFPDSTNFLNCLKTFQTLWNLSRQRHTISQRTNRHLKYNI